MIQVWRKCLTFASDYTLINDKKDEKINPDDTDAGMWHDNNNGTEAG